ncbi:curli-like amyloid fiber formation chaperone CsgH [uncultured Cohaesibacter sp.]|uniref:curli-like amyloid fiber formation chaperone CsgH n=1 Tax=uncultured Cohaesibacter sp. TaxID=1002546 RepID=UPI0029C8819C|nr:curli-like amyloid fiber formation chaperone CsgH [uncultured Cohaesibacter sp.]
MIRPGSVLQALSALIIGLSSHSAAAPDPAEGDIRLIQDGQRLVISDVFTVSSAGIYETRLTVSKAGQSGKISSTQGRKVSATAGESVEGNRIAVSVQKGDRIEAELVVRLGSSEVLHQQRVLIIQDTPTTATPDQSNSGQSHL